MSEYRNSVVFDWGGNECDDEYKQKPRTEYRAPSPFFHAAQHAGFHPDQAISHTVRVIETVLNRHLVQ